MFMVKKLTNQREVFEAFLRGERLVYKRHGLNDKTRSQWLYMGSNGSICEEDGVPSTTERLPLHWRSGDPEWHVIVD